MASKDQVSKSSQSAASPALFLVIVALVILIFVAFLALRPRGTDSHPRQHTQAQPATSR